MTQDTITVGVRGPAWSRHGLDLAGGLRPLRVETHVGRMVARLVPGLTTVTTHARYFLLHPYIFGVASDRGLDREGANRLIRRAEVVIAAVSSLHDHDGTVLPEAHGQGPVAKSLSDGVLDPAAMSQPGIYSKSDDGFYGTYGGSQVALGLLSAETIDDLPGPGPRWRKRPSDAAFAGLIDLIDQDAIDDATLKSASHLCVCGPRTSDDGGFLTRLFTRGTGDPDFEAADQSRRLTATLLGRVAEQNPSGWIEDAFIERWGFGPLADDMTDELAEQALAWRGTILRNYSVTAWRRLWAWMVDQLDEPLTIDELADRLTATAPDQVLSELRRELRTEAGTPDVPLPIEATLAKADDPASYLSMLLVGAIRSEELKGTAGDAFRGDGAEMFSPEWMHAQIAANEQRPVAEFARDLARTMTHRAINVALSKSFVRSDGIVWMPARIREREGRLYRVSPEGSNRVGMRIGSFAQILAGVGVLSHRDGTWHVG